MEAGISSINFTIGQDLQYQKQSPNGMQKEAGIKSPEELDELNKQMMKDKNPYKRFIDFSRKRVYRVFPDGKLGLGGRFYGPWYQNIKKQ